MSGGSKADQARLLAACDESGADEGTSRRAFLKLGAAAAAGAASLPPLADSARAQIDQAGPDPFLRRVQQSRRILFKGGIVLTLDRQVGDFASADVLIEDGRIREVRPEIAAPPDIAVIDAVNRILIPGFVDTHSHSYQGLLRSLLANGLLEPDYNRDIQNTLSPAYRPDEAYAGILITALGMIESGTTTIVDLSQVSHSPEHSDACVQALKDSGIRAVYSYARGAGPNARYPQDITRLQRAYFNSSDQLLTLALTGNFTADVFRVARAAGVPVVQHVVGNNMTEPLLQLARAGLLREGDEYIHCLGLNDEGWKLIKDSGGHVSICAPIDMAMGHGMPAIQESLDQGIRFSFGSDHAVAIAPDSFSVMRSTFTLQRLLILQRARNGERNLPALLTCRDVLEFATLEGARCANLLSKVGTLTPGKEADIVMLRTDRLDVYPVNNAYGTVANLMNPSHVDSVFIAGKPKKWRGNLVDVDASRIMRMVQTARDALLGRTAFRTNLLG